MNKDLLIELKVINKQLNMLQPLMPELSKIYDKVRKELDED